MASKREGKRWRMSASVRTRKEILTLGAVGVLHKGNRHCVKGKPMSKENSEEFLVLMFLCTSHSPTGALKMSQWVD
jgi:hypothetical protein